MQANRVAEAGRIASGPRIRKSSPPTMVVSGLPSAGGDARCLVKLRCLAGHFFILGPAGRAAGGGLRQGTACAGNGVVVQVMAVITGTSAGRAVGWSWVGVWRGGTLRCGDYTGVGRVPAQCSMVLASGLRAGGKRCPPPTPRHARRRLPLSYRTPQFSDMIAWAGAAGQRCAGRPPPTPRGAAQGGGFQQRRGHGDGVRGLAGVVLGRPPAVVARMRWWWRK